MSKSRLAIFCIVFLLWGSFASFSFAALFKSEAQWSEYKSEHFIISYRPSISDEHVREFARNCERYYHLITERLGFARFDFWLWEDRARVFIYKNRQDYLEHTSQPEWSQASVHSLKKSIDTYSFEEGFFDSVLPHELTHIILREFIGTGSRVPLWFEEGAACANERESSRQYLLLARELVKEEKFTSVAEIEAQNIWSISSPETFYPAAAFLVIFLLEDYERDYFVYLCRELRDGADFYRAMDKVYGIKNAEDLNERALNFLKK